MKKPIFKVFSEQAQPTVQENCAVILVDIINNNEQTTKLVDSKQLREIANYLDSL